MDKISCVLVPGAAGPAGINTIKSLRMGGFTGSIIATDSSDLAAGFYLSSKYCVMPEADNHEIYAERLLSVVSREKVQILMPSSGYDIYSYAKLKRQLEGIGARPIVSSETSLEICRDKLLTFKTLADKYGNAVPFTTLDPDKIQTFPVLAKPRFGKGSRDVIKIEDEDDLQYVKSRYQNMIFQEFLPGEEYSVDVLSDLDGVPIMAVPRLRMQTKAGISTRGKITRSKELELLCMNIARSIGIIGPSCIQVKRSDEGTLKLVEVNPRMGGGTIFTTLAGANFPKMIVDMVEGKEIVVPAISEITVVRHFNEIVVDGNNISNDISNPNHMKEKQARILPDSIA